MFVFCHFVCTVTDFSAAEKDRGVKFCMRGRLLRDELLTFLVNFGSRKVTAAALLPGCMQPPTGCRPRLPALLGGDSELGAVARWGSRN